ncbi:hypothetical protein MN116_000528, partial [Schistosoma mekongi]
KYSIMNGLLCTVTSCTILLLIMCNFNEMNAVPSGNGPKVSQPPTNKSAPPPSAKPTAATPKASVPSPKTPVPKASPAAHKASAPTPKASPAAPTVTNRPHDERGVLAASVAPIVIGLVGQFIGYILHYIAS